MVDATSLRMPEVRKISGETPLSRGRNTANPKDALMDKALSRCGEGAFLF